MKPRTAAQRMWLQTYSPKRTTSEEQVDRALNYLAHRRSDGPYRRASEIAQKKCLTK